MSSFVHRKQDLLKPTFSSLLPDRVSSCQQIGDQPDATRAVPHDDQNWLLSPKKEPVTGATGDLSYEIQMYWNSTRHLFRRHIKVPQGILQAAQIDLEHIRVPVHGVVVAE